MIYEFKESHVGSYFGFTTDYLRERSYFKAYQSLIWIHWNRSDFSVLFTIDGVKVELPPGHVTTTTYFQKIDYQVNPAEITSFAFNREFYCINELDHEVSCNGIIFFGTQSQPLVTLASEDLERFELLLKVLDDEFKIRDSSQAEMLRILLKRLIITVTRLAKAQTIAPNFPKVK